MDTTTTQFITLIGVVLNFIVGSLGLYVGYRNSRKTNYINSVTSSRIKYIQDIRNKISEFCGLVCSSNLIYHTSHSLAATPEKQFELQRELDKLKYLIKLHLNPEDTYWDDKILKLIDEIIAIADRDPQEKVDDLITITQFLLKLEWEGAKMESQKGILTKKAKDDLNKKHIEKLFENVKK
jgi:hypothetical protein